MNSDPLHSIGLVAGFDRAYRQVVCSLLEPLDVLPVPVQSWRSVLAVVAKAQPVAVILDVDGMVSTERAHARQLFRACGQLVPLIVLGYGANVGEVAEQMGADDGLRKPINVGALLAAVQRLCDNSELPSDSWSSTTVR